MAKFETDVSLDELMTSLTSVDIEAIAPLALEQSAPIVEKKLVQLSEPHRDTGAMIKSIKAQKASKNKDGYSIFVGASGVDRKTGIRNMEKMAFLEFGVREHNQPATPVITPAVRATHDDVCDSMQETFNKYIEGQGL